MSNILDSYKFVEKFKLSGKQGFIGLVEDKKTRKRHIYKLSQSLDFLIDHETKIMRTLTETLGFLPHFCKLVKKIDCKISSDYKKSENPFELTNKPISSSVLLMEYVENARKFYRYIKNQEIDETILYVLIKQVLLATLFAQKASHFTHYDLHSNNVLVKTCDPETVNLYVLDEKTSYHVPTYGYYPVIIDYGFSYADCCENQALTCPLYSTDIGFTQFRHDPISDLKLFLVSISYEIKKYRKIKTLHKIVSEIFEPLSIDWECGWDDYENHSASQEIYRRVKKYNKFSTFFKEQGYECVNLLQALIRLPLKRKKYNNIELAYKVIVDEFHKIELELTSGFYTMYIFKSCIDAANQVRDRYQNPDTSQEAVREFKYHILTVISTLVKYCHPKLDWERLLCSMLSFATQMEGLFYSFLEPRVIEKQEEYDEMDLKDPQEIYENIDMEFPIEYHFSEKTVLNVYDLQKRKSSKIVLSKTQADRLNGLEIEEQSQALYNIYKTNK